MRMVFLAGVVLAFIATSVSGAVVEGTLYNYAFEPVQGIVQVNSTPMQTSVASNGTYRLEIEPGVYLLSAISRDNATSSQVLDVRRDGNYRLDMVLFEELD